MRSLIRLDVFALTLAVTALAQISSAGQVFHSTSVTGVPLGGTVNVTLPQFDPSLGVLRQARISVFGEISGTLGFENVSGAPVGVGGYASGTYVGANVPWQIGPSGGAPANPAYSPPAVMLPAYDGTTDYAGTSGITHVFAGESGDGAPSQAFDVYQDAPLQSFAGTGTVAASAGPLQAVGPWLPNGIVSTSSYTVRITLSVRYDYDAFPAAICRAATWSGCPCGNFSQSAGGCGNSANANGGTLSSSGVASLANDTLVLHGSGMTNSSALYFQGTTFSHAQTPYGDGLRCVGGSLIRLGTRMNVGGASQAPLPGGTPISQIGAVALPGTRYYQVYYRDAQTYCTSAPFNLTSGLAIAWLP